MITVRRHHQHNIEQLGQLGGVDVDQPLRQRAQ